MPGLFLVAQASSLRSSRRAFGLARSFEDEDEINDEDAASLWISDSQAAVPRLHIRKARRTIATL